MKRGAVDAGKAIEDIRSGMDDAALMQKYGISIENLERLFTILLGNEMPDRTTADNSVTATEPNADVHLAVNHHNGETGQRLVRPDREHKRVLAIGEDGGFVDLLHRLLTQRDIHVSRSTDEIPGVQDVVRMSPDLVLLDLGSSETHPHDLMRRVKLVDNCIPLVLVTDREDHGTAAATESEGIYEVVEKSASEQALLRVILRGLEYSELSRFKRDHVKVMQDALQKETMEIARTKDFLNGILNSSTLVSVILTDLDQNVLFWNTGAENIFGYKAHEIVGTKITRLYPADSLTTETVDQLRSMVQRGGETVQGKMNQLSKDGRVLTMSLAVSPMLDGLGKVQGILGIGLDVTEEVRQQEEIVRLLSQVKKTREASIFTLAKLAESRDEETGLHLNRIQEYCRVLCRGLSELTRYRDEVTPDFSDDLYHACVLHDIGKVAVPDAILMSSEKFGPKEREIMERHPLVGGRALEEAVERLGEKSLLTVGMEVAYYHHEHWDGAGYPFGLKGPQIPLSARIVAVADVYDALTAERRYKRTFSHEETCTFIVEKKGTQFDPDVVEVFQDLAGEFRNIRNTFTAT
ncbi:MAG: PAS domain S-box protein [Desulfomonilaceae bacterium]|nr:PAS domain S-box protein [Desulfomonilaceae bacterium]